MLGSMFSAVSGLSSHQTKMNVIGNNIANVNTYGFKSSRVTFSDVFYQTMNGASAPSRNAGGSNPTQLGYGARLNSIDVLNTRAGSATTDRALDVYINGEGYLPVKNADGIIKYTRIGILNFDVAGNLVDSNGNMVLGFKLDPNTKNATLDANGTIGVQNLVPIKIEPEELSKLTGIAIGNNGDIVGIREGDPAVLPVANTGWLTAAPSITKKSLYNGPLRMTSTMGFAPNAGSYTGPTPVEISTSADIKAGAMQVKLDAAGDTYTLTYTGPLGTATATAGADKVDKSGKPHKLTFQVPDQSGGNTGTVTIPLSANKAEGYDIQKNNTNVQLGNVDPAAVQLKAETLDKSGAVVTLKADWTPGGAKDTLTFGDVTMKIDPAKFDAALKTGFQSTVIGNIGPGAGIPMKLAHIGVVKFTNADGLSEEGEGYFVATVNSGEPVATTPGSGGTGTFRAGALEMSNVDLSREFTEMIITQRGFQANTRMITVSDEMLSELISMKR